MICPALSPGEKSCFRTVPPAFTAKVILPTTRPAICRCWHWWRRCGTCSAWRGIPPWAGSCWRWYPLCATCAIAALVYREALRGVGDRAQALRMGLFTAFCPLMLFATGIWKQVDAAFALPLVLCFWLLERRRFLPAAFLYGVALAIKPQALLAGPVLALCFLLGLADAIRQGSKALGRAVGRIFGGAALALAVPLAAALPFYGPVRLIPALIEKYITTTSGYLYATVNAFNWFAALGGNWTPLDDSLLGPVTWGMAGAFNIVLVTAAMVLLGVTAWLADRRAPRERRRFSPLLLAGFYLVGVFTFGHCMHERYLVPGVLLVLLAAARWGDIRLYGAAFGLSLTGFLNLAAVYTQVGTEDEWLTSATSRLFTQLVGFVETAAFLLLAFTAWSLSRHGLISPLGRRMNRSGRVLHFTKAAQSIAVPETQPRWDPAGSAGHAGAHRCHGGAQFYLSGQPDRTPDTAGCHRRHQNPGGHRGQRHRLVVDVSRRQYRRFHHRQPFGRQYPVHPGTGLFHRVQLGGGFPAGARRYHPADHGEQCPDL